MTDSAGLRVEHIMNGVLMHADHNESLSYITKLLVGNNANAVIVREKGIPIGIITARDIVTSLVESDRDPDQILAKEVMTAPIISVDHDTNITSARDVMVGNALSKLPVRNEVDIVGLLIQDDIIRDMSWYSL